MFARFTSAIRGMARLPRTLGAIQNEIAHQTRVLNERLQNLKEAADSADPRPGIYEVKDIALDISAHLQKAALELKAAVDNADPRAAVYDVKAAVLEANSQALKAANDIKVAIDNAAPHAILRDIEAAIRAISVPPQSAADAPSPPALGGPLVLPDRLHSLPFPDVMGAADPIGEMLSTVEFLACAHRLATAAPLSLLAARARALIYCLVRNLRPDLVVEIGTYRAGTTELICAALAANGCGRAHTVDPFGAARVPGAIAAWPSRLRGFVDFFPINSMEYFAALGVAGCAADLVFIDGNHDYEFVQFDLAAAARVVAPGGFIVLDNIDQAGPCWAVLDFLQHAPGWAECGGVSLADAPPAALGGRTPIDGTALCVLRAPSQLVVTSRPMALAELPWTATTAPRGMRFKVCGGVPGTLDIRCALRSFSFHGAPEERQIAARKHLTAQGDVIVEFPPAQDFIVDAANTEAVRVEPALTWDGAIPLLLGAVWAFV